MVYLKIKRLIDIILSGLGLIILSPVFLVLILAIKVDSPGPVLFKQKRVGIHKSHFHILKFRTMRIDTPKDTPTHLLENPNQWITKVGKFLRKTSLDELPQLINVLKGDMAIIGPRPLLPQYLPLYSETQKSRHNVRPGITGWAQVNGRNAISWSKKFELDVWYVDNISLILDVKIFFLTIKKVFVREGISQEGQVTMEAFNGNN